MLFQKVDQQLRLIAARVDLFDAHHGGGIRHAPGMNVEHGRYRHVNR